MEGNYTKRDGSPDKPEDVTTCLRIFSVALGHLFKPNEGVVVELEFQKKRPDDPYGKFCVWRNIKDGYISTYKIEPDDELFKAENGQLIWMHDDEE
jgi:hypothetical protein